jgi:large subunit ribosomal protein L23
MDLTQIIKKPVITEKTIKAMQDGCYVFVVDKRANKHQIKEAVEKIFEVKVEGVRTIKIKGKKRRVGRLRGEVSLPSFKKAVVKLKKGQKIDLLEMKGQ